MHEKNKPLLSPVLVTYIFAPNNPWLRQERQQICRTIAEYEKLEQLAEEQPDKFKITGCSQMPCRRWRLYEK